MDNIINIKPINVECNSLETKVIRKGFLGIGRKEKHTVEITIEDSSKDAKMHFSITGRNKERVELRAKAVFAKLQEQVNQGGPIDLSKVRVTAEDIKDQKGIQKGRLALSVNKMIGKYLKTRTDAVKVIQNPSFSWFGSRLEKAAKSLHRGDITARRIALEIDDFSVKYFSKEMKVLKDCQTFDPTNKAQLRAWGMFYAKMRVVAAEHDKTKTADLLSNSEVQAILKKGVDFFGSFEFLSSGKPSETDAVLKDQNISVKYVKGMVRTFKHVLDLTKQDITLQDPTVAKIKSAMAAQHEEDVTAGYLSALGNREQFNAVFKQIALTEDLSKKNFNIHQRALVTKFYQLQSKYMEKFYTALNTSIEKTWADGDVPTDEQMDKYIAETTAHFDLILKLFNDYNKKYNDLNKQSNDLDGKFKPEEAYGSVGDYIRNQGQSTRNEFIYFLSCALEKDLSSVNHSLNKMSNEEMLNEKIVKRKLSISKLLSSPANINAGAMAMVGSSRVPQSKKSKVNALIMEIKKTCEIVPDYEISLKIIAEMKSVAHEGVIALAGAMDDKKNKALFHGNDMHNMQIFQKLLADIEALDFNGENFHSNVQGIVNRLTPDFLMFLQNNVATEVSLRNEKLKGTGGEGTIASSLAVSAEKYMAQGMPVIATKEALERNRSGCPTFGVFITQRLTRMHDILERILQEQRPEGSALLIGHVKRTIDTVNAIPAALIACNADAIAILESDDKPRTKKSKINALFKGAIALHPHLKGSLEVAHREALACHEGLLNTREYFTRYHDLKKQPLPLQLSEVGFYVKPEAPVETFIRQSINTLEAQGKSSEKKSQIDKSYKQACKEFPEFRESLKIAYGEALSCHRGVLKKAEYRARYRLDEPVAA